MLQTKWFVKRGVGNWQQVTVLHYNVCPYAENFTVTTLATFSWGIMNDPHYSSDLAPIGFQLFWPLKEHLEWEIFNRYDELQHNVQNWLCGHAMSMQLASVPYHGDGKNVPLYWGPYLEKQLRFGDAEYSFCMFYVMGSQSFCGW
jgi:hypothetical protein